MFDTPTDIESAVDRINRALAEFWEAERRAHLAWAQVEAAKAEFENVRKEYKRDQR